MHMTVAVAPQFCCWCSFFRVGFLFFHACIWIAVMLSDLKVP
jgi:hypothetical protein